MTSLILFCFCLFAYLCVLPVVGVLLVVVRVLPVLFFFGSSSLSVTSPLVLLFSSLLIMFVRVRVLPVVRVFSLLLFFVSSSSHLLSLLLLYFFFFSIILPLLCFSSSSVLHPPSSFLPSSPFRHPSLSGFLD